MDSVSCSPRAVPCLNESSSKKERKWSHRRGHYLPQWRRLNESLHLKVQNKLSRGHLERMLICLIESPSKKKGKFADGTEESTEQFEPQ